MVKKHCLILLSFVYFTLVGAQTNLMPNWCALSNVGAGSTPADAGWQCMPLASLAWTVANGSGGCRFVDYNVTGGYTGYLDKAGGDSTYKKRLMYIRWDAGNGSSAYTFPLSLTAGKSYRFKWKYAWNSNASAPVLTAGVCTATDGTTGSIVSKNFTCSATAKYLQTDSMVFRSSGTGTYYISVKSSTSALCGIADLSVVELPLTLESNTLAVNLNYYNGSQAVSVLGSGSTSVITVSAPTGVTLTANTLAAAGGTVTVSSADSSTVSGNLTFQQGADVLSIPLSAVFPPYFLQTKKVDTVTVDGAWCWFNDPRALYYKGTKEQTYFSWVTQQGNIVVASYNHATKAYVEKVIHANYEADDHDNPALFFRKDGRIVVYYSKHTTAPAHRWISTNPEDISSWGTDYQFGVNVTYPYPFQVRDSVFVMYRGLNWHPTLVISNDNGETVGTPMQLISGGGARPYARYCQDKTGAIHMAFTTGHPRDVSNNRIYYAKFQNGKFYRADGTLIKDFGWGTNPLDIDAGEPETVYDGTSYGKGWIWDIAVDSLNRPVLVYASFPTDTDHQYHYARWNGSAWVRTHLTNAGKWFPQTPAGTTEPEPNYSGGINLDPGNPNVVYLSKQVRSSFEIFKFTTRDNGLNWDSVAITWNTPADLVNVRPVVPRNHKAGFFDVLWLKGKYVNYGGGKYYTSVVTSMNADVFSPVATLNGGNGSDNLDGANFVSFTQNSIMTFNGWQYICYWNAACQVALSRRKLPNGPWQELNLTDYTTTSAHINDNHYNVAMGICPNDGTIHLAFDHHGDVLHYRLSKPGLATNPDAADWSAASFYATRNYLVEGSSISLVTYPRFVMKPNGDLLYECRLGTSGNGDDYLWEYKASTGKWTSMGQYLNGTTVNENAYINGIHYDPAGKLHVSWVWRQTPDAQTNHDLNYIYSEDDGLTWKNTAGTVVGTTNSAPVVMSSAGIKIMTVGTNRGLINQESQAVDSRGKIHLLNSFLPDGTANTGFWDSRINNTLLYHIYQDDAGTWVKDAIALSTRNRSQIAVDGHDNLFVLAAGYRIYYAKYAEKWKTWYPLDLSQNGTIYNEGLIDREMLKDSNKLSFVFAKAGGEIIVPEYSLDMLSTDIGTGLKVETIGDTTVQSGLLKFPAAGAFTLYFTAKGNTELFINGKLQLRTINNAVARTYWFRMDSLSSAPVPVVLKSWSGTYAAETGLAWSSPSLSKTNVPISALYQTDVPVPASTTNTSSGFFYIGSRKTSTAEYEIQLPGSFQYSVFESNGRFVEEGFASDRCKLGAGYAAGTYLVQIKKQYLAAQSTWIK